MRVLSNWLTHLFFPSVCLSCRADLPLGYKNPICPFCLSKIEWACRSLTAKTQALEAIYAGGIFDGVLRDLLHAFKFQGKDYLAPFLADLWLKHWDFDSTAIDCVAAVPMPFFREIRRGYNQSDLLARELAQRFKKEVIKSSLSRRPLSRSQVGLSKNARFRNAVASFRWGPGIRGLRGKRVLLIDDICTTGATLEACARLLKKAGAQSIIGATLARELT